MLKEIKISFCTTCMNRLNHLHHTLLANIHDNANYKNLEFILLDYNSTDGLENYVKNSLKEHIKNNRLIYYKTSTPNYFNRSHSRNLMFKLATGDVVCNIDADNFTGVNFAGFVNNAFQHHGNIFLTTLGTGAQPDVLGRICLSKQEFLDVGGFDERMENYGFEDYDIINRLYTKGLKKILIDDDIYWKAITHQDSERISNEYVACNLEKLLVHYISPASSELLLLFKNGELRSATAVDNKTAKYFFPEITLNALNRNYEYSILQDKWFIGKWEKKDLDISIDSIKENIFLKFDLSNNSFHCADKKKISKSFYEIKDTNLLEEAAFFYSQLSNRIIMENNKKNQIIKVNKAGFGKDIVYKNFDYQTPVLV